MISKLFKRRKHLEDRYISDLLAFITTVLVTNIAHIQQISDHILISFIFMFLMFAVLYMITGRFFKLVLGSRNRIVGFGSYALAAAVLATISTFFIK